ncbi:MAG: CpsD/CapB family tyrosine-protein kinase [Ruminococcaceae bacterium]|nr:CpsD/CapB family tyrosine-protein kinase [Oscillospiraceae bacterium]
MLKIFKKKKSKIHTEEYIEDFYNGNVSFEVKEAFNTVRTNIMFATNSIEGCKKIIITSSVAGEGKSTSCLNLAMAIAQVKSKVLLIDADLRKPTIYKFLKLDQEVGLSSALGGFSTFEEVVKKTKIGVDCIPAGPVPPNAAELLASDKMGELLEWASDKYDYILLDTPPVNIVSDATILSKYAHGTILVARNKYTAHPSIVNVLEALEFSGTKVFGFLLNDKDLTESRGYYKYGGYRYGYGKYGYGYGKSYKTGTGEKDD